MQFNEGRGGGSYLSQKNLRLHFGLRPADKMDKVEVNWPSGQADLPADFIYRVTEGQGTTARVPLPPVLGLATSEATATR